MKKKIITGCSIAFVLVIIIIIIFIKLVPGDKITNFVGSDNDVSDMLCAYPVRVQGDSMAPVFNNGDTVNFSKCIEDKESIPIGAIIIFNAGKVIIIGRIRECISGPSGIYYRVSPEARMDDIRDVYPDTIIGWYEE